MSERANILGRVRAALTVPAPRPGDHTQHEGGIPAVLSGTNITGGGISLPVAGAAPQTARGPKDWLPPVGESFEERVALFAKNSGDLKTDFCLLPDENAAGAALRALAVAEGWTSVASHRGDLTEAAVAALGLPVTWTDDGYDPVALEQVSVGLTACDALVAQTGSVLVTSRTSGGRSLSVLPPHHVVLARRDQLVTDLPTAFTLLAERYAPDYPSMISFITGPSRTGDIERILVLGAHGPKKLTILCV